MIRVYKYEYIGKTVTYLNVQRYPEWSPGIRIGPLLTLLAFFL